MTVATLIGLIVLTSMSLNLVNAKVKFLHMCPLKKVLQVDHKWKQERMRPSKDLPGCRITFPQLRADEIELFHLICNVRHLCYVCGVKTLRGPSKCDRILVKHFNDMCAVTKGGSVAFEGLCFGLKDELDQLVTIGGSEILYSLDRKKIPPYCNLDWVHRCLVDTWWFQRDEAPDPGISTMEDLFALLSAEDDSIKFNITDISRTIPVQDVVVVREEEEWRIN